jgi:hypothetical protein
MNDRAHLAWYQPAVFEGPLGQAEWKNARWSEPGNHRVICKARQENGWFTYEYQQIVAPLEDFLDDGLVLPVEPEDPVAVLNGVTRYLDLLEDIGHRYPPTDEKKRKEHDQVVESYRRFRDRLLSRIAPSEGLERHRVHAEHFGVEAQTREKLRLFLVKVHRAWLLVDWTNPASARTTGEYRGEGPSDEAAIRAAIEVWRRDNRYPDGGINYRVEGIPGVPRIEGRFNTDASSLWDSVSEYLSVVAFGAAVIAGVVTFLAPVPGSQVVSGLIWASIFSSTAAATINIAQREAEGFGGWRANAFDVLTIAGNLLGGTGTAMSVWRRGAEVTLKSGTRTLQMVIAGQFAMDGVQGVMIAADHYGDLQKILDDPALSPKEKTDRVLELLRSLTVQGLLLYVNFRGTKADIKNARRRSQHVDELTPGQRLEALADEGAKIDLTKPPKVEGHTTAGPHRTTVQVQQPAPPPKARRGRNPDRPRTLRGPQRTNDLDGLYAEAQVALPELADMTRQIARDLGGEPLVAPLKTRESAMNKILGDLAGDASGVTDLARSTIIFQTEEQVMQALASIKQRYELVQVKDRFAKPLHGYRDVLMNVKMSNGHIVEIQLHIAAMLHAKEGLGGHKLYEQHRALRRKASEEGRRLTGQEAAELVRIEGQMRALYGAAYEAAKKGKKP